MSGIHSVVVGHQDVLEATMQHRVTHSDRFNVGREGSIHVKVPKQPQAFVGLWIPPDRVPIGYHLSSLEGTLCPAPVIWAFLLAAQGGTGRLTALIAVNLNEEFNRSSEASSTGTSMS